MADTTNVRDVSEPTNIAVLVDGDNAQPSLIEAVLAEAVKYGTITVRRIYKPALFRTRVSKNEHNAAVIDVRLLD